MTTFLWCVACFVSFGLGMLIASMAAASARADERAAEAAMKLRLSDRLVRDFHVVRDEDGDEHLIPITTSPPDAAEDSSPSAG